MQKQEAHVFIEMPSLLAWIQKYDDNWNVNVGWSYIIKYAFIDIPPTHKRKIHRIEWNKSSIRFCCIVSNTINFGKEAIFSKHTKGTRILYVS